MSELAKCPFCDREPKIVYDGEMYMVWCKTCEIIINGCDTSGEISAIFNKRPIEDALRARIAELENRLLAGESAIDAMQIEIYMLRQREANNGFGDD